MHIICLTPLTEGVYNDHCSDHITIPPEGWAYIPENFPLPSTFPRLGSLEADEKTYTREVEVQKEVTDDGGNTKIETVTETLEYTMMTATIMTEGTLPKSAENEPTKTIEERVATLEESSAEMTEALDLILSGVTE